MRKGDKVKLIFPKGSDGFTPGNIYIVEEITEDPHYSSGYCLHVQEDDNKVANGWCLNHFELMYVKEFNNKLEELINE